MTAICYFTIMLLSTGGSLYYTYKHYSTGGNMNLKRHLKHHIVSTAASLLAIASFTMILVEALKC